jgi:hypothetical protein
MRLRTRRRKVGRRLVAAGQGGLVVLTGNNILTITDGGGEADVTTAAAHGLGDGVDVTISGTSVVTYNDTWTITTLTATTFRLQGAGFQGISTGGTWALV